MESHLTKSAAAQASSEPLSEKSAVFCDDSLSSHAGGASLLACEEKGLMSRAGASRNCKDQSNQSPASDSGRSSSNVGTPRGGPRVDLLPRSVPKEPGRGTHLTRLAPSRVKGKGGMVSRNKRGHSPVETPSQPKLAECSAQKKQKTAKKCSRDKNIPKPKHERGQSPESRSPRNSSARKKQKTAEKSSRNKSLPLSNKPAKPKKPKAAPVRKRQAPRNEPNRPRKARKLTLAELKRKYRNAIASSDSESETPKTQKNPKKRQKSAQPGPPLEQKTLSDEALEQKHDPPEQKEVHDCKTDPCEGCNASRKCEMCEKCQKCNNCPNCENCWMSPRRSRKRKREIPKFHNALRIFGTHNYRSRDMFMRACRKAKLPISDPDILKFEARGYVDKYDSRNILVVLKTPTHAKRTLEALKTSKCP